MSKTCDLHLITWLIRSLCGIPPSSHIFSVSVMGCPWNLSTFVNSLVYTVYNLLRGLQKTTTWRDCNRLTSYLCFHGYPSNNTSRFLHWRSPQHLGVTVSAACPQHKRPSRETSASPFLPEAWACEGRFVGRSNGPNPQEILKLTAKGAENRVGPKRKGLVSQWWFFGGYVSFSECRWRLFFLTLTHGEEIPIWGSIFFKGVETK